MTEPVWQIDGGSVVEAEFTQQFRQRELDVLRPLELNLRMEHESLDVKLFIYILYLKQNK